MRKPVRSVILWTSIAAVFTANGCSSKSDDDSSSDKNEIESTSMEDLNLSGALTIEIPDSVAASGTSLALASTKKSSEACRIRSTVREGIMALSSVANMFCHFEAESDKIDYGIKYNIEFEGGQSENGAESFQLWIDNSNKANGELTVYFCEDNSLTEKIILTGAKDGRAKGSMKSFGSSSENDVEESWGRSVVFDNSYTELGRIVLTSKDKNERGSDAFRRLLSLDLLPDGVSKLYVSEKGSWQGDEMANAGVAKIDSKHGMALYTGMGTHSNSNYEFSSKAFFNDAGMKVESSTSSKFEDGGDLFVDDSDVPGFLPTDFEPDGFSTSDWDCSADETISIDPEGKAHEACEVDWDRIREENCWGSDYEDGEKHQIDEDKRQDAEKFDVEIVPQ